MWSVTVRMMSPMLSLTPLAWWRWTLGHEGILRSQVLFEIYLSSSKCGSIYWNKYPTAKATCLCPFMTCMCSENQGEHDFSWLTMTWQHFFYILSKDAVTTRLKTTSSTYVTQEALIQVGLFFFFSEKDLTQLINTWIPIFKYFRNQRIEFTPALHWT